MRIMDKNNRSSEVYSLGLYEKAMPPGMSFKDMLLMTGRCGFDRLEISIDESDNRLARLEWTHEQMDELKHLIDDTGVPIKTMCLSGHRRFPFGSHDKEIRVRSRTIMKKAIDFSSRIGISIIQLAGYDVYYEDHDQETAAKFEENLLLAAEYAAKQGVILAFETMETPFMDTVGKAMYYVNKIQSPYLGIYPDIGNLKNAAVVYGSDLLSDIQTGKGHIFAAHLKETKPGVYRDLDFGTGHTEYDQCIKLLWRMGVRMFTGEFWFDGNKDVEARLVKASTFLRSKIDALSETG
jgi:L-ribulose-5-phosphate 3-epimerase